MEAFILQIILWNKAAKEREIALRSRFNWNQPDPRRIARCRLRTWRHILGGGDGGGGGGKTQAGAGVWRRAWRGGTGFDSFEMVWTEVDELAVVQKLNLRSAVRRLRAGMHMHCR